VTALTQGLQVVQAVVPTITQRHDVIYLLGRYYLPTPFVDTVGILAQWPLIEHHLPQPAPRRIVATSSCRTALLIIALLVFSLVLIAVDPIGAARHKLRTSRMPARLAGSAWRHR
jgi:hypothetical protein